MTAKRVLESNVVLRAFKGDRRGATAVVFALSLPPILAALAFVVDYGVVSLNKAALDAAADSAILAATVAAADTYVSNGGDFDKAKAAGVSAGQQWYKGELQMAGFPITPEPPLPDININLTGTTFAATLSYTTTSPSYFASLLGYSTYNISGSLNSTYTLPGYLDLIMMIDNSPSMTIIADLDDWPGYADYLYTMYRSFYDSGSKAQGTDCMFACHDVNTVSDTSQPKTDLYYIAEEYARKIGVNLLRIDVVRAAIQSVLQSIQGTQANDHYRVGLYTFNDAVITGNAKRDAAQQVFALGSDFGGAAAAAKGLLPLPSGSGSHTDFPAAVSSMRDKYLSRAGDGLSAATPKKTLILITDGTNNVGSTNISPFDPTQCQSIKDLDITIYVMYTEYYPINMYYSGSKHLTNPDRKDWYDPVYNNRVKPLQKPIDQIQSNLRSCASTPDKYYSVSDSKSIQIALSQILTAALAQPGRFTQ